MRKVLLNMNEFYKYDVIKKLVISNGNKRNAASKLKCSSRHINRLIHLYLTEGKSGFIHKNSGRQPAITFPADTKERILRLYRDEYSDCNFKHFTEIIQQDMNVSISDTTINKWLRDQFILSPKARRLTKKATKKTLKTLQQHSSSKKKQKIEETIQQVEREDAHPRCSRCKYMGEMIQMDASSYHWIKDVVWHLHVAIDDASGMIVGAFFDTQETLYGYYNLFQQLLTHHGIPCMFYTDRRTVFEYKRKNTLLDENDTFTQFAYACHQFGVAIKTTSVAQAKGRVERLNATLQSRLPIELRRAAITNIEDANVFLHNYVKEFNQQFALSLDSSKSAYEKQPTDEKINQTLAILSNRKIDHGHSIKYKHKYYIPVGANAKQQLFRAKSECLVIEALDKRLFMSIGEEVYAFEEIQEHEQNSKELDQKEKIEAVKKAYIPPMSHPWKAKSFKAFQNKQKHRKDIGANV